MAGLLVLRCSFQAALVVQVIMISAAKQAKHAGNKSGVSESDEADINGSHFRLFSGGVAR